MRAHPRPPDARPRVRADALSVVDRPDVALSGARARSVPADAVPVDPDSGPDPDADLDADLDPGAGPPADAVAVDLDAGPPADAAPDDPHPAPPGGVPASVPGASPPEDPPTRRPGAVEAVPPRPRTARRWAARVVATLLVTALAGVGVGVLREREARAAEVHAQAAATLSEAAAHLHAAQADGRTTLASSAGRVADDEVRSRLAAVLLDLPATEPDPDLPRPEATAWCLAQAEAATERATRIAEVAAEVRLAWDAWELDRAQTGHAEAVQVLADAAEAARVLLADTEGRVLDDAAREVLADAVVAADGILGAPAPDGTAALDASAVAARAHAGALVVATADVATAREAWQAEQDRLAAERAAASAMRSSSTAGAGVAGSGSSGGARSGGGSASGSGAGSGSGPGRYDGWLSRWSPGDPVPDGWTVVVETEGGGWGGDEHGGVWDLG